MPASMSAAAADPLAEREARLVDELRQHPAADEPRRVADPLRPPAERGEEPLRRRRGGAERRRRARQLDQPAVAHRGREQKPAALAARVLRGERRGVAQQQLRPALERRVVLRRAAVDDQERHLALGLAGRRRRPSRRRRPRRAAAPRAPTRPRRRRARRRRRRSGRRRVGGPARRIRVPARAGLAPEPAARRHPRGQRRRPPARLVRLLVERARDRRSRRRSRRGPSARTAPSGSRAPRRQMRSTCSGVASRSCTIRSASSENGRLQRLTRKPGPSAAAITCLPSASPSARARASAARRARRARDELDQPHPRHRVEEVQADHALGPGHAGRDLAHEQRRRVRGEHRVRRDDGGQRGEQRALDVEPLGRGLDHHVARREVGQRRRPLDALDALARGRVGVVQHARRGRRRAPSPAIPAPIVPAPAIPSDRRHGRTLWARGHGAVQLGDDRHLRRASSAGSCCSACTRRARAPTCSAGARPARPRPRPERGRRHRADARGLQRAAAAPRRARAERGRRRRTPSTPTSASSTAARASYRGRRAERGARA